MWLEQVAEGYDAVRAGDGVARRGYLGRTAGGPGVRPQSTDPNHISERITCPGDAYHGVLWGPSGTKGSGRDSPFAPGGAP